MTSPNWKTVAIYDTGYPADSVEWCPFENYFSYFVCGTYFLLEDGVLLEEKNIQERVGNIQLFSFIQNELVLLQTVESDGILDIKWSPTFINGKMFIGCVTAKGDVKILEFIGEKFVFVSSINFRTDEVGDFMVLALNWLIGDTKLCVSDNKGSIGILNFNSDKLYLEKKWRAHDLEAWTVAFSPYDSNLIYSGGDDAKLKIWDARCESSVPKADCNRHDSGVTIIQPDTGDENLILVGSFDEILNFWDPRALKVPKSSVICSGGIWRVKRLNNYILTANIYGGYQIIELSSSPKVLGNYREHSSLAYGADWNLSNYNSSCYLIGTCSFYDKKLTISTWDPNKLS